MKYKDEKKHGDGHMSKEKHMSHKGADQGDMSPVVEDFQRPTKDFSQEGFSKTLQYIERKDKLNSKQASTIRKDGYEGRYS
jgi:hypothetical protein